MYICNAYNNEKNRHDLSLQHDIWLNKFGYVMNKILQPLKRITSKPNNQNIKHWVNWRGSKCEHIPCTGTEKLKMAKMSIL